MEKVPFKSSEIWCLNQMSEMKIVKIWAKLKADTNQSAREFKLIAKQIIFLINKVKYTSVKLNFSKWWWRLKIIRTCKILLKPFWILWADMAVPPPWIKSSWFSMQPVRHELKHTKSYAPFNLEKLNCYISGDDLCQNKWGIKPLKPTLFDTKSFS